MRARLADDRARPAMSASDNRRQRDSKSDRSISRIDRLAAVALIFAGARTRVRRMIRRANRTDYSRRARVRACNRLLEYFRSA